MYWIIINYYSFIKSFYPCNRIETSISYWCYIKNILNVKKKSYKSLYMYLCFFFHLQFYVGVYQCFVIFQKNRDDGFIWFMGKHSSQDQNLVNEKDLILSCSATPKCKSGPDQGQRVHFDQKQINPVKGMRTSDHNIACLKLYSHPFFFTHTQSREKVFEPFWFLCILLGYLSHKFLYCTKIIRIKTKCSFKIFIPFIKEKKDVLT